MLRCIMRTDKTSDFASLVGGFFLISGIWGLFSDRVFIALSTNLLHASIHFALGVSGLILSYQKRAHGYSLFVGALLITVGLMRFMPFTSQLIVDLFNLSAAGAILNLAVGSVALSLGLSERRIDEDGHVIPIDPLAAVHYLKQQRLTRRLVQRR